MRNHIAFKFLAILVCALSLTVSIASATGIIAFVKLGLYSYSVEDLQEQWKLNDLENLSLSIALRYEATKTSCTEELIEHYIEENYPAPVPMEGQWSYILTGPEGEVLEDSRRGTFPDAQKHEINVAPIYPRIFDYDNPIGMISPADPEIPPREEIPSVEEEDPNATIPEEESNFVERTVFRWRDEENRQDHIYILDLYQAPMYKVTLFLAPDAYEQADTYEDQLVTLAHQHRYELFLPLVIGLLLFAAALVYLCLAAGKNPRSQEVNPAGLNRMPLDLYAAICAASIVLLVILYQQWIKNFSETTSRIIVLGIASTSFLACLMLVGFLFALAAQIKKGKGTFWKSSFLWGLWRLLANLFSLLWRFIKWLRRLIRKTADLLPSTWQWLLGCILVCGFLGVAVWLRITWLMVTAGICTALVFFHVAFSYHQLLKNAQRMSSGDLDIKIDSSQLSGSFADFAGHLNALADVAIEAARKQMKSERMKAELITNVSHDIKTPLTSIINYVDLMQKTDSQEDQQQYLEVLSRQSQRLKKLIDDLMELSKASTGNMQVNIQQTDAVETLMQALGEFSDKLDSVSLTPIFEPPQEAITMLSDGRLTWRVLSNLLSNAVKYALPGTRLYIDIAQEDNQVLISLKNISRQQLNVSSEELMERFVRGDAARNTEGSGLGLNIAKSLMELQKGELQLLVDGDLFKATLIFPAAKQ